MLGVRYCGDEPVEPIIVVLEKVHLEAVPDEPGGRFPFVLNFHSGSVKFFALNESQREEWMVKVGTCSFHSCKFTIYFLHFRF